MVVLIYGKPESAPYRTVLMTAELVGAPYQTKVLAMGEHRADWFLKLNPQHNFPFLVDGDFSMNECRPMAIYLVRKYGKKGDEHPLYPSDPELRARVDQRLSFDSSAFYAAFMDVMYPQFLLDPRPPGKIHNFSGRMDRMNEVLGWANGFARDSVTGYIAGTPSMSVADIAFAATYSTVRAFDYFDLGDYADLNAWMDRMEKEIPKYGELCKDGAEAFAAWFRRARVQ